MTNVYTKAFRGLLLDHVSVAHGAGLGQVKSFIVLWDWRLLDVRAVKKGQDFDLRCSVEGMAGQESRVVTGKGISTISKGSIDQLMNMQDGTFEAHTKLYDLFSLLIADVVAGKVFYKIEL